MKRLKLLLVAALVAVTTNIWAQGIIPVPTSYTKTSGEYTMPKVIDIYTNLHTDDSSVILDLLRSHGVKARLTTAQSRCDMTLVLVSKGFDSGEAYSLDVTPGAITAKAKGAAGLYYAVQSLLQMIDQGAIEACEIYDSPRYGYRGLMLDVSRHFRSKEFVLKQIDALAHFKLNRLHLHLTDGAGWRIEIDKYPRLTEFAAWRPNEIWKDWWTTGGRKYVDHKDPTASGGFYTKADLREIVEYADKRNIIIIPEIEMPGHSEEVLAAYPELSCSGEPYKHSEFCVGNEKTYEFLEGVLDEVLEIFPSHYIHIGGDEANKSAWEKCPLCQKRMKEEGHEHIDELQSYLVHRIERYLNSKGRSLMGWDEIVEGGLSPTATVMSWRGEDNGIKAIKQGNHVVMTPSKYAYLDYYQDAPHTQPEAIGGFVPLEMIYSYEPAKGLLTEEEHKLIDGVQANLWTEYVPTEEHCEYMIYPRILAIAEIGWSQPSQRNWEEFRQRAIEASDYLRERGYNPFDLRTETGNRKEATAPIDHLARGKKVTYNAPFNASYVAAGDVTLTDGQRGGWTYSDGNWQGFISRDRFDVVIDLEAETPISEIFFDCMQGVGAEVYLPVEVIFSVSSDGENFTELQRNSYELDKSIPTAYERYSWSGSAQGRYIKLQARASKEHGGWVFVDEVVVK